MTTEWVGTAAPLSAKPLSSRGDHEKGHDREDRDDTPEYLWAHRRQVGRRRARGLIKRAKKLIVCATGSFHACATIADDLVRNRASMRIRLRVPTACSIPVC